MREQWPLFESNVFEGAVQAREVDGTDELNRLFKFQIHLRRPGTVTGQEEAAQLLDTPASLRFEEDGDVLQHIFGFVSSVVAETDAESDTSDLFIDLVPRVWLLTQRKGSELFLDKNVPEVIAEKLKGIGLQADQDFVFALRETYPMREIIAQHEETDHAFVSRLCEHNGIVTFFEHRDGKDVWILTDTPATYHEITRAQVPVRRNRSHPSAWGVRTTLRRVPAQAESLDYNYRAPLVSLRENKPIPKPAAKGAWIEYGPHTKNPIETAKLAKIRTEEIGARHHVVTFSTSEASVRAGGTIRLTDTGGDASELLIVKATFKFRAGQWGSGSPSASSAPSPGSVGGKDDGVAWENDLVTQPAELPFRPPRITPWPQISGLVNAVVDGAIKGDYAELDDWGRYHLRMFYDRSGRTNLSATHPVRMMQPHAGANYGMHFPLRPGTEVLVGFVNGDPDRPIIVGTAPNPTTVSPVERKNQTQNVLRTGSNNEMVIEDEHGTERIRIHTPHQNTTVQLGAPQEAEEGALTVTDANISEASRLSNNEATRRKTLMADTQTALLGKSAIIAAGSPGMTAASDRGLEQPSAMSPDEISRDLKLLSMSPSERKDLAENGGSEDTNEKKATVPYAGLWSNVGADVTERTQTATLELVRAAAADTDNILDQARGRTQGEPLGSPLDPSVLLAADRTVAMVGREIGFVYGDRIAALASHDTASVAGKESALVKSPGTVEMAGGKDVRITSAGTLDAQAHLVRVVAGYYPATEAPPLDDGTTIGVMSRKDLRMISVEDCILICAKKNIIGTAHTGDIKLTAKGTASISAGSIVGTAGNIKLKAKDTIEIEADGDITIKSAANITIDAGATLTLKGADVVVSAGSIGLEGPTTTKADHTVTGAFSGG